MHMHDDQSVSAPHRNAPPGAIITFGVYPQTAEGTDQTPIRWRVLQNSGGKLLILSEHILDCKRYHGEYVDVIWRDCDVRKWLNGEFYDAAFSVAEKGIINVTCCADNGESSPDTEDQVFLLSVAEVMVLTDVLGKDFRRAIGTAFAKTQKADSCQLYVYDKSVSEDYLTVNGEKHGCSWWWLRTQGNSPSRAFFIGTHASMRSYCRVNRINYGVRPALRLDL
jgi:hypothetical protein